MESRTKQGFPGALPFFGNNREQEDARERHGRDEGREYAEHENEGKALHDTRTEPEENDAGNNHGEMSVANGRPRATKADMHRFARRLTGAQLLFGALKYKHVRVHRHADRDDEPRDTGGGERDGNNLDDGEHECEIFGERERTDETGEAVPRDHKERDDTEADGASDNARADGGGAERRTDGRTALKDDRYGERAEVEIAYQIARLGRREASGDSRLSARNHLLNNRGRDWLAIEENGELCADIFARNLFKKFCSFTVKIENNFRGGKTGGSTRTESERRAREIAAGKAG